MWTGNINHYIIMSIIRRLLFQLITQNNFTLKLFHSIPYLDSTIISRNLVHSRHYSRHFHWCYFCYPLSIVLLEQHQPQFRDTATEADRLIDIHGFETQKVAELGFDRADRSLPPITFKLSYILVAKPFTGYIPTRTFDVVSIHSYR